MGLLFNAKKHLQDEDPRKPLTRYKRKHVRNTPTPDLDSGNVDPNNNLTRAEARHVRAPLMVAATPRDLAPSRRSLNLAADLHSTGPIPIEVLRRSLPLRCALLDNQTV